jgi:hypothetical protein
LKSPASTRRTTGSGAGSPARSPAQFRTARGEGRKGAAFIDNYTETAWSLAGVAMDGEYKGRKLTPVPVEEGLTWGVMKYWYPKLELHHATTRPSR